MLSKTPQAAKLVELFKVYGVRQQFNKNEFIIHPGESPPGVFYIEEGLVKAYDITKYNEENLLIIRKDNEIFPLIWALTGQDRSIVYQAITPTIAKLISRKKLIEAIEKDPQIMAPLLDMAIEMYRLHSERILNLEYRSVRERLASFLLTMVERFNTTKTEEGIRIEIPLRHQDIASSINASRETASREISSLERKGLISSKNSLLTIKDIEKIRKIVN